MVYVEDAQTMRGLSSLPLDDDIIDRVLTFLPDYQTLRATILASKSIHHIFKTHPNSILRAVSYNVTGPALPQAIRVLRYAPSDSSTQTNLLSLPHPPRPWAEDDPISPITDEECKQLRRNAEVVNALEDLFCLRHKDRSSQSSVLDFMESWRFRRAMYRAMLFAKAFQLDVAEDFDDDSDQNDQLEARFQRKRLLQGFSNDDLRQLRSATLFLIEVADWAATADGLSSEIMHSNDVAVVCGPAPVLAAYQARSVHYLLEDPWIAGGNIPNMADGYLTQPLKEIWEERKEKPPPDDSTHWNSILKSVHGENDTCQKCNFVCGLDLWNETNWEYLTGYSTALTLRALPDLVKGHLSRSVIDGPVLRQRLNDQGLTYTKLLNEIHQIRTPPYDTWDKPDWMCSMCFTDVMQRHLHLWLLERKRESGEQIPEDCWYGYNCRTQTHKMHHAARVNHLCEPTR